MLDCGGRDARSRRFHASHAIRAEEHRHPRIPAPLRFCGGHRGGAESSSKRSSMRQGLQIAALDLFEPAHVVSIKHVSSCAPFWPKSAAAAHILSASTAAHFLGAITRSSGLRMPGRELATASDGIAGSEHRPLVRTSHSSGQRSMHAAGPCSATRARKCSDAARRPRPYAFSSSLSLATRSCASRVLLIR